MTAPTRKKRWPGGTKLWSGPSIDLHQLLPGHVAMAVPQFGGWLVGTPAQISVAKREIGGGLSEKDVTDLVDGTDILVIWSGGNGPYHYKLRWDEGRPYAVTDDEWAAGRFNLARRLEYFGNLEQPYLTQVWLA